MPPVEELSWNFVTRKKDSKNKWTCPYCPKEGSGIGRVKSHILGQQGNGISCCTKVPDYIRDLMRSLLCEEVDQDIVWKFVIKRGGNKWCCHHCGEESSGDVTGVKDHLLSSCTKVPAHIRNLMLSLLSKVAKEESRAANNRSSMERLDDSPTQTIPMTPGDSNFVEQLFSTNLEDTAKIANFTQQDVIQLTSDKQPQGEHRLHQSSTMPSSAQNNHFIANDSNGGSSDPRLEPCTRGHANENTILLKRKLDELINTRQPHVDEMITLWKAIGEAYQSVVLADREKRSLPPEKVVEVEDLYNRGKDLFPALGRSRQGSRACAEECSRGHNSVPTELVGRKTHEKIDEIYSFLMEYNITIIGVYGKRKVGKTAILKNVHSKLLEGRAFNDVYWVTVPQDFTEYALQEAIANVVGLDNLSNEALDIRANSLHKHLKMKDRSIIIFDGLLKPFVLEKVGIPIVVGGLKLVLTTESYGVCLEMHCQKLIQVEFLDMEAAWSLFLKTLCFAGKLPFQNEGIARSIVHSCAGRPSCIIDVATFLRRAKNKHEWNEKLQEMERGVSKQ